MSRKRTVTVKREIFFKTNRKKCSIKISAEWLTLWLVSCSSCSDAPEWSVRMSAVSPPSRPGAWPGTQCRRCRRSHVPDGWPPPPPGKWAGSRWRPSFSPLASSVLSSLASHAEVCRRFWIWLWKNPCFKDYFRSVNIVLSWHYTS